MPFTPVKTLDPTRVRAIITTKWAGSAYKAATVRRVESYSIASHLDSDADPWQLELGNVDHSLNAALARDNEVRVQVFGAGPQGNLPLLSGIMDDASYSEAGTLVLTGRDMSSIPVDSDHWPNIYRSMSPTKIIQTEATDLRCASKFQITPIVGGPKKQQTDGSEKYWEFWYRMVRKDGFWIWMLADGTLVVSKLNYNDPPVYLFTGMVNAKAGTIPVQNFTWHKTTQSRIGKLGVAWRTQAISTGKKRSISIFEDVNIKQWIRKPQKLIEDKHAISEKTAYKIAVEELFESRVGAIEIQLTVADPGFMIRQNKMAHVDLPEYGIKGDWFVVGSTLRGGTDGFLQDVRLREKKFAISARVPNDPIWTKDPSANSTSGLPSGQAAVNILSQMGGHEEWYECFLAAAQKWHGLYDLALFMAVLLAICDHETTFSNIRSDQAANPDTKSHISAPGEHRVEWYDIRDKKPTPAELDDWKRNFANTGGDNYIPRGYTCAVGPMQLFTTSYKEEADKIGGGKVDEFFGNRWDACKNIMTAAHVLNGKSPTKDGSVGDLYRGVCNYGAEGLDSHGMCGYSYNIKNRVENDPGWLQLVQDALASAGSDSGGGGSGKTSQWIFPVEGSTAFDFSDLGGPCGHVFENGPNSIWQNNSAHDIGASGGTKFLALADGKISDIGSSQSSGPGGHAYGVYLIAADGSEWYYAHVTGSATGGAITAPPVLKGQPIKAGALIGYANRWDGHLHLAINAMDKQVSTLTCNNEECDPIKVFRAKVAAQ